MKVNFSNLILVIIFLCSCDVFEKKIKIHQPLSESDLENYTLNEVNKFYVNPNSDYTLIKDQIVSFKIDSTSRNFTLVHSFYKDSVAYFVNRNEFTNSIDFYNYQTGDLEKRLTLKQEEPNGITKLEGFYIHNLDSIFAYSRRDNIIHLYDFNEGFKKHFDLPNDKSYVLATNIYSDMLYESGSIYFSYSAIYPLNQLKDTTTIFNYNLKNGIIKKTGPKYPKFIAGNNFLPNQHSNSFFVGHNNNIIIRFRAFPISYVYYVDSDITKVFLVKSKYHKNPVEPWDGMEDKDATYMKASYGKVCYDPYRKVYYHLFSLNTPYLNEEGEKNTFDDKQMSVIITDTTFQVLGEKLLEKDTYFRNMLVSEEGLLISTANAYNKEENESEIRFQLFKLDSLVSGK
jgi:hypothetical protein